MEDKNLVINIENYNGNEPIEVIYRKGEASQPVEYLPTKEPEDISLSGVISTPRNWLEKRVHTINEEEANIVVDRDNMDIKLTINENDYYTKATFTGTVQFTDVFKKFGINDLSKGWRPAELGQFLRLNRNVFEDMEACMRIVSLLKNFTAKCKAEIQKQRDPSGAMADVYRQEVESNLPKAFTVNLPIIKGMEKVVIDVEFDHYIANGDVMLQLVSPAANEIVADYTSRCIDSEIEKIKKIAPQIVIVEV